MIKNKKGFTLVELLVVIALLGLIIIISVPGISKIRENMNERTNKTKLELIEDAGILWGQDNKTKLQDTTCNFDEDKNGIVNNYSCFKIKIYDLIDNDYLEYDDIEEDGKYIYLNPKDNSNIVDNCVYIYKKNNRVYAFYSGKTCN